MDTIIKLGLTLVLGNIFCLTTVTATEVVAVTANHSANVGANVGTFRGTKNVVHPTWFKESFLNLEEDIEEATEKNKRIVVYFWQFGCPYCDQLWRDNFTEQKIIDDFRQYFDIVALNIWGDREIVSVAGTTYSEKTFAEALDIKYTPTLLFFDEHGKVIHRLNGYVPVENFQKSMRYVSGKHEKKSTFSAFSAKENRIISSRMHSQSNKQDFSTTQSFNLSKNNDLASGNKFTLILFESENCENCNLLHQKTLKDPSTLALAKKFTSVELDRYSTATVITPNGKTTTVKQWATDLGVEYLPTMIFFDDKGNQVMRIDTQLRTFHIQSVFDYVLSKAYKTETNFQRYISARADRIRETGKDVDIFNY